MMKKLISILLCFAMLATFATACGGEEKTDTTAIAGEYVLDASNLGMPMKWFIKVTEDAKFSIATDRAYSNLKGEGTIGNTDDTYMFVYSDSTNEAPKTATFKAEGANLVFSTNVPIGAASVSPKENEDGTTDYPTAKGIKCEENLGTYMGTYVKESAMAGTVNYNYELTLGYGLEYTFASSFSMMNQVFTITESGLFAIDGDKITFTATVKDGVAVEAPAAVEGTIANKEITAAFKLSAMAAEPQSVTAKFATYADVAGEYVGVIEKAMGPMVLKYDTKLVLDAFGGYKYTTSTMGEVDYTEEGTYTYADKKFTFTSSAEGATAVEATFDGFVITTKFPMSAMVSTPVDTVLYADTVSGAFAVEATEEEVKYNVALELKADKFALEVKVNDAVAYTAKGTFTVTTGMMSAVVLTTTELTGADGAAVADIPAELATISAPVSDSGININLVYDLDDSTTIGFALVKVTASAIVM